MKVTIDPGKYVLAVSGGVDSMTLLHLLLQQGQSNGRMAKESNSQATEAISDNKTIQLIVAHFDHGIRPDSAKDRQFVEEQAKSLSLQFFYEEGGLGKNASEATARAKRYEFLRKVQSTTQARAIITAHHQDDLIETMIINLLRGTGRKGLSSLANSDALVRPLLRYTKAEIVAYAQKNNIEWVEDQTNTDEKYFRNEVRKKIMPKLSAKQRKQMITWHDQLVDINQEIDKIIKELLADYNGRIKRAWFLQFPYHLQAEIVAQLLRREDQEINQTMIAKAVVGIKTLPIGKQVVVSKKLRIISQKDELLIMRTTS